MSNLHPETARMQPHKTHMFRFLVVGMAAFVIDAGVLSALVKLGVPPGYARVPSVSVAIVFTWVMNRRYTFTTQTPPSWHEFAKYAAAMGVGIAVNFGVFLLVLALSETARALPVLAVAIATLSAMTLNFLSARFLLHR